MAIEVGAMRKNTIVLLLLALACVLAVPGCATLTRSRTQKIPVTSTPAGAAVIVNGRHAGMTPIMITLSRKQKGQVIRIESPGYDPVEIRPQRKPSAGPVIGNVLLGLIPAVIPAAVYWGRSDAGGSDLTLVIWGLSTAAFAAIFTAVDAGEGRAYELKPTDLTIALKESGGPPRVDTVLIDDDDLRSIRWIRIHSPSRQCR
jgi:hypothetical protein